MKYKNYYREIPSRFQTEKKNYGLGTFYKTVDNDAVSRFISHLEESGELVRVTTSLWSRRGTDYICKVVNGEAIAIESVGWWADVTEPKGFQPCDKNLGKVSSYKGNGFIGISFGPCEFSNRC